MKENREILKLALALTEADIPFTMTNEHNGFQIRAIDDAWYAVSDDWSREFSLDGMIKISDNLYALDYWSTPFMDAESVFRLIAFFEANYPRKEEEE